jgi:hypothetical protein
MSIWKLASSHQLDANMSQKARNETGARPLVKSSLCQALVGIALWMAFGLLLEGLLGYKIPAYLQDQQRRELLRLAHTHGTLLNVVLLATALLTQRLSTPPPRTAQIALQLGVGILPFGFLLAGLWHYESDPGIAIWLVPPAALLVIFGIVALAFAARSPEI